MQRQKNKATRSPEISRKQVQKLTTTIFVFIILDSIYSHCPYLLSGETTFHLTSCSNSLYCVYPNRSTGVPSAGISPSETECLLSAENNYCDRNTTYPLYITSSHCWYDLLKQKTVQNTTYLSWSPKVKQFQWFCHGYISVKMGACFY